jgi:hypothetical protein
VQVDRRRRDRRMAQVIPHRGQFGAASQGVGCMRVPGPVRPSSATNRRLRSVVQPQSIQRVAASISFLHLSASDSRKRPVRELFCSVSGIVQDVSPRPARYGRA